MWNYFNKSDLHSMENLRSVHSTSRLHVLGNTVPLVPRSFVLLVLHLLYQVGRTQTRRRAQLQPGGQTNINIQVEVQVAFSLCVKAAIDCSKIYSHTNKNKNQFLSHKVTASNEYIFSKQCNGSESVCIRVISAFRTAE